MANASSAKSHNQIAGSAWRIATWTIIAAFGTYVFFAAEQDWDNGRVSRWNAFAYMLMAGLLALSGAYLAMMSLWRRALGKSDRLAAERVWETPPTADEKKQKPAHLLH